MGVVDLTESIVESIVSTHSKVQDKKLKEWFLYDLWTGPCRRMPHQFAEARNKYPKIPAEKVDIAMFVGDGLTTKLRRALNLEQCSVLVRADYKGNDVVKRTILVTGGNVEKLEAAAKHLNKQQKQQQ